MSSSVEATLPRGLWIDGKCIRDARLRPLTREDEAFLMEISERLLPAQWTTVLLSRCLESIGPFEKIGIEIIRSLCIGDREALLLNMISLYGGSELSGILSCPALECNEKMELNQMVSDFLFPPYDHSREIYETTVNGPDDVYFVRFRLPDGGDQEAAVEAGSNANFGADIIMQRCIKSIRSENGHETHGIPPKVALHLSELMAQLDPQSEVILNLVCPFCGENFSVLFDSAIYLHRLMDTSINELYKEVHTIALCYHWSEVEILGMSRSKRHRYLKLLQETFSET